MRLIHHVLLLQGDDGEIGPRGLPGESVSVQGVEGGALRMPREGYGHKRDILSLAHACHIFPSPGCRDLEVSLAPKAHLVFLDPRYVTIPDF